MRHPLKLHSFEKLKDMGLPISTIIDVGILTCTADLMHAFPDKKHILVEPIAEFEGRIRRLYEQAGIDYALVQVAAADEDGTVNLKTSTVREGKQITHSRITENFIEGADNFREVPALTLDTIVDQQNVVFPALLKIDVDGAEALILKGAKETLEKCSVICVEAGIKTFLERAEFIIEAGFELFDIVDICYYDDRLVQTDMVFVNKRIIEELGLEVYRYGFDIAKWYPYQG